MVARRAIGVAALVAFVLCGWTSSFAQMQQAWALTSPGTPHTHGAASQMVVTDAGDVYVVGATLHEGEPALVVEKHDRLGAPLWRTLETNTAAVLAYNTAALSVDLGGYVLVLGLALRTNQWLPIIIKYAPDGSRLWLSALPWTPSLVRSDILGNVLVAGRTNSPATGWDFVIAKFSATGAQLWQAEYRGSNTPWPDTINDLEIDANGNVYVTGQSVDALGNLYFATLKYGPGGGQLWEARVRGSPRALALDRAGNVYVTGTSVDGYGDYLTVKYDPAGQQLWEARYNDGIDEADGARDIAVDDRGNVYVTGESVFDNVGGVDENWGIATAKYDASGVEQWVARFATPDPGFGSAFGAGLALTVDQQGRVYVTGHTSHGFITLAYETNGHLVWFDYVEDHNGSGHALALDSAGDLYVHGHLQLSNRTDYLTLKYTHVPVAGLPVLTLSPHAQTIYAGETATFAALATGSAPLAYQWRFNGRAMPGQTNSALVLINCLPSLGGQYSVIVSNSAGLTISPEARLGFHTQLQAEGFQNSEFRVRLFGDPYQWYCLQVSSDLHNWQYLASIYTETGTHAFIDPPRDEPTATRFYRALKSMCSDWLDAMAQPRNAKR